MAKLSARGRTEVARMQLVQNRRDSVLGTVVTTRYQRALMSDGNVLYKVDSQGWKMLNRSTVDADAWIQYYESMKWTRVK